MRSRICAIYGLIGADVPKELVSAGIRLFARSDKAARSCKQRVGSKAPFSAAQAWTDEGFKARLKPGPTQQRLFSAACSGQIFVEPYGSTKVVP
jgi:hypothetical protein